MEPAHGIFEIETQGDTVIVTPTGDLGEFSFRQIEEEAAHILELLEEKAAKNMLLDFHKTERYGSTALGFFLKLWKRVRGLGGHMAFCNVSEHELEVLRLLKLDTVWASYTSRAEALEALRGDRKAEG